MNPRSVAQPFLKFPVFEDSKILTNDQIQPSPIVEFDQDIDTDEDALEGSKDHIRANLESSMREFFAIPKNL